jgi:hypothetical protein
MFTKVSVEDREPTNIIEEPKENTQLKTELVQLCSRCSSRAVPVGGPSMCDKCTGVSKSQKKPASMLAVTATLTQSADIKSYNTCSPAKHDDFIRSPLREDLLTVPGIGPAAVEALNAAGIHNTWQLIGKYMYGGVGNTQSFHTWLSHFSTLSRNKDTIVRAISEKVAIAFGTM